MFLLVLYYEPITRVTCLPAARLHHVLTYLDEKIKSKFYNLELDVVVNVRSITTWRTVRQVSPHPPQDISHRMYFDVKIGKILRNENTHLIVIL